MRVIGGAALAFHGYIRATVDLELATSMHPYPSLSRDVRTVLARDGFEVAENDDPLCAAC